MTQPAHSPPQQSWSEAMALPLATAAALAGAFLGAFLHHIAYHSGFYAIILVGVGAGFATTLIPRKKNSIPIAIIAALITLLVAIWAEWWTAPFIADDSFSYFLSHFQDLAPFRLLLHAAGIAAAFVIAWIK